MAAAGSMPVSAFEAFVAARLVDALLYGRGEAMDDGKAPVTVSK